jgi:hypothetical protein
VWPAQFLVKDFKPRQRGDSPGPHGDGPLSTCVLQTCISASTPEPEQQEVLGTCQTTMS